MWCLLSLSPKIEIGRKFNRWASSGKQQQHNTIETSKKWEVVGIYAYHYHNYMYNARRNTSQSSYLTFVSFRHGM